MANVIPSLIQASQYQQEAANRGIQQVADFLKQKKIRQLGQAFVQQGDYTPEGIQKFAQQNNLSPQDMGGIVQVASAFEDFKRQREHDALQKQQYADKQRYYADQLALDKDKLEYEKSRLTQNDQAAQAKAAIEQSKYEQQQLENKIKFWQKQRDYYAERAMMGDANAAREVEKYNSWIARATGEGQEEQPEPQGGVFDNMIGAFQRGAKQGLQNERAEATQPTSQAPTKQAVSLTGQTKTGNVDGKPVRVFQGTDKQWYYQNESGESFLYQDDSGAIEESVATDNEASSEPQKPNGAFTNMVLDNDGIVWGKDKNGRTTRVMRKPDMWETRYGKKVLSPKWTKYKALLREMGKDISDEDKRREAQGAPGISGPLSTSDVAGWLEKRKAKAAKQVW
jgi:hypothetical protein